jgi:hypothetical protein
MRKRAEIARDAIIPEEYQTAVEPDAGSSHIRIGDVLLFSLLIGVLTTIASGYYYGLKDHIQQLPVLFREIDGSYLSRDFFVNASDSFGPRFYYLKLIAALEPYCPIPILYLLLTCLCNVLVCFITYLVSRELFRGSNLAAMMACVLVMTGGGIMLGHSTRLHSRVLIPSFLILPLALLSLWMGIRKKPLICGALSGLASIIHPLLGIESGAIGLTAAGLSVLFELDGHSPRKIFSKMIRVAIGAIILGLFAFLLWIVPFNDAIGAGRIDSKEFIDIYGYLRAPHHLIPSTFSAWDYVASLCLLIAFVISWKWWHDDPSTDRALSYRLLTAGVIVLLLCAGGYLFVEVFPSRIWMTAQPFRLVLILNWLGLMLVGGTIARIWKRVDAFERSYTGWLMLIGSGILQPFCMLFGHILELILRSSRSISASRAIHLGLVGLSLPIVTVALIKYGSLRQSLCISIFIAISFWFLLLPGRSYRSVVPMLSLCAVIALFAAGRYYRIPFLSHYLDRLKPIVTLSEVGGPLEEISAYARENTPEDSVFLTPPLLGRFRLSAGRAIIVDFKAFLYPDRAMAEWKERLSDCYGEVEGGGFPAARKMDGMYRDITKDRILSIAGRYGATHVVLYKETPTEFPILFQNDVYKIVRIAPRQP